MWSSLTNTIPHGVDTIMYMVTSVMAVGHFAKIFDSGKNGLQLTDDSKAKLRNEFDANDPNVFFSYVPFPTDYTKRPAGVCSLDMFLLQNVDVSDKVIIIADTRHTQRWSGRENNPTLCKGDSAFFCNCPIDIGKLASLGTRAHSLVSHEMWMIWKQSSLPTSLGAIAEDQQVQQEDQAEQRDQGTIDEVLGNQDMEEGGDVLEEADREADLLEQVPLLPVTQSQRKNA